MIKSFFPTIYLLGNAAGSRFPDTVPSNVGEPNGREVVQDGILLETFGRSERRSPDGPILCPGAHPRRSFGDAPLATAVAAPSLVLAAVTTLSPQRARDSGPEEDSH